jgi:hypothetical protein
VLAEVFIVVNDFYEIIEPVWEKTVKSIEKDIKT